MERTTVGEIVAADFRAASVFERFGIDFCCGGRRLLVEACRAAAADPQEVVRALEALPADGEGETDRSEWSVDQLIDYIVTTHHAYVRSSIPLIAGYLAKLSQVHGVRHPELSSIAACFEHLSADLQQHLVKEEQVLFPYLRQLAGGDEARRPARSPFGTVANPIRMMEVEHQRAGDELRIIRELTRGYRPPSDGCATYAVCMTELERFERDLHRHVHLENNVLFPRALELEEQSVAAP